MLTPHLSFKISNSDTQYLKFSRPFKYLESSFSFEVDISSGGFAFKGEQFFDNLEKNIQELEEMDRTLKDSTILRENYMESFIKFEMLELGHLNIEAFIVDIESKNSIKISFSSDQTVIKNIIDFLKSLSRS